MIVAPHNTVYSWHPDLPDQRDHKFASTIVPPLLPPVVDLRKGFPTAFNQLDLGSCTANALAGAVEFDQIKQGIQIYTPSRLFIYYNERYIEGTVHTDSGATLRDGCKAVAQWGTCSETRWPYNTSKFKVKPPQQCFTDAAAHKVTSYQRVNQTLGDTLGCLAAGYPFVFGFSVYESFESNAVARTGIVPMPGLKEVNLGGHAPVAAGYNNTELQVGDIPPHTFIVRNSWGPFWGVKGYCFMPFQYVLDNNLADDLWTIRVTW